MPTPEGPRCIKHQQQLPRMPIRGSRNYAPCEWGAANTMLYCAVRYEPQPQLQMYGAGPAAFCDKRGLLRLARNPPTLPSSRLPVPYLPPPRRVSRGYCLFKLQLGPGGRITRGWVRRQMTQEERDERVWVSGARGRLQGLEATNPCLPGSAVRSTSLHVCRTLLRYRYLLCTSMWLPSANPAPCPQDPVHVYPAPFPLDRLHLTRDGTPNPAAMEAAARAWVAAHAVPPPPPPPPPPPLQNTAAAVSGKEEEKGVAAAAGSGGQQVEQQSEQEAKAAVVVSGAGDGSGSEGLSDEERVVEAAAEAAVEEMGRMQQQEQGDGKKEEKEMGGDGVQTRVPTAEQEKLMQGLLAADCR